MLSPAQITETVHAYLAAINAGDMPAVMALYAEDAAVEDPAGSEPKHGADILEFYTNAFSGGASVKLTGAIGVSSRTAAFPFRAEIKSPAGPVTIVEVIDIFEFNDAGKVKKMTAHFGPTNMSQRDG